MGRETTITLAEDVAAKLDREAQRVGLTPDEIVNATLRRSLPEAEIQPRPFRVRARNLGPMTGLDVDCTERLLNQLEGPHWK